MTSSKLGISRSLITHPNLIGWEQVDVREAERGVSRSSTEAAITTSASSRVFQPLSSLFRRKAIQVSCDVRMVAMNAIYRLE